MDILFLAHRSPFPPDRGDRIRSWHVLRYLARRARVHLVAFTDGIESVPPELTAITASCTLIPRTKSRARGVVEALTTGRPVSSAAFADRRIASAVEQVLAEQPIKAIYAFSGQMAQYLPANGLRAIMDFVDVDSLKFAQFGSRLGALAWLMRREARLLGAFERDVAARVKASVFVSEAEAALFRAGGAMDRIVAVPNGIDAAYFAPDAVPPHPFKAPTIVFTGQMDYRPNIDAVNWFACDVLPLVRVAVPDARFAIVGRAPTAAVRALARNAVEVTGEVPDTRPWLAGAAVCVAPLSLARGVQNKVLEAMAMARPVVATSAAAEGIDHGGALITADGAEAFAVAVIELLTNPTAANERGSAGRARVLRHYGWDACLTPLDALLGLPDPTRVTA